MTRLERIAYLRELRLPTTLFESMTDEEYTLHVDAAEEKEEKYRRRHRPRAYRPVGKLQTW